MKKIYYILILLVIILIIAIPYITQNSSNGYDNYTIEKPNNISNLSNNLSDNTSNNLIYDYDVNQDHEEYDKIVGYDDMGYPIYVSYYYTSGNGNMEAGVYRYVGNDYSGYDIEYVSSDWQHEYQGDW